MAYAVKYLFKFQSSNGTVREIRVLKDGYTGAVIQRPLGRAPVIKKEQNGGVHGTSLTFYAECHVDREFIEFYTSDPKEYRVDVYAGSTLLWQGYITPELYSEPDIAPPYDVQVVATDGVGELKLYDFEPQGTITLRSLLSYLLGYTGLSTDVNLVSSLKPGSHGAGALLDMQICVDYLEGKTCYEVLTYLLDTLHATITRWGGAWLLVRETNVTYANDKVRYFTPAGNSALLSGSVQTLGSMRSAPAWPVGQLSMVIDPAKNKVAVQAPWHPLTCLANADMTSDTAWTKANNSSYGPDGYLLPNNDTGESYFVAAHISQSFASAGLRVPMTFELKATGVAAQVGRVGAVIGVLITYTVGSTVYLLRRGDEGTPVWKEGREPGASVDGSLIDYYQPLASFDADRVQAETLNINEIPAFVQDTSYPSGTLTVYIVGTCARVYSAYLDVVLPKGYQDVLRIDNGARGEGDTVEIAIGRETADVAYYAAFLQGLLLDNGALITSFTDANFTDGMNYLALIARDYALSVALPRASVTGKVYLENSIGVPPLVFAKGGLNYWTETWSWDLYEDELEISARTLPSASLTVQSETILESDGSTVSSASPAGSSGSGGSFPGGANFFELDDTLVRLKGKYDYLGPRKGLIFGLNATADSKVHLEVVNAGTQANPVYALHSPLPFYSDAWISAGGVSSGGGAGGGTVVGATVGGVDVELIDGVLKFDAYPTAASLGLGNIAFKNSLTIADVANLQTTLDGKQAVISDLATIRNNASNGATAYSWGNHASAGYALASNLTAHTDNLTIHITAAERTAWNNKYDKPASGIPYTDLADSVKSALDKAHEHANKTSVLDKLKWDEGKNAIYIGDENNRINFFVYGGVASGGFSDTPGVGGGTVTGATVGGKEVTLSGGILEFDAYPTTTSLGLKNLAFKDSLSISEVVGLQSALSNKQDAATAITTSNYNSYAPKLDGTGASGTWGININGNAASANNAENISSIYPQLAASLEADEINVKRKIAWNNWGDGGYQLEAAIDFNWYETHNLFGVIRGGGMDSDGFGWMYSSDGSTYTPIARLSPSGDFTILGAITGVTNITASGNATIAGNVGIGTTSPAYKLDVNGPFNATTGYINGNTVYHSGNLTASVIAGLGTLSNNISGNAATATNADTLDGLYSTDFIRNQYTTSTSSESTDANSVLTNSVKHDYRWTNTPLDGIASLLDLTYSNDWRSQIFVSHSGKTYIAVRSRYDGTTWGNWRELAFTDSNVASAQALMHSNGTVGAVVDSSGNIGIGTTSPSAKLHVVGNILATGAVTAGQASDARLKSNIVTARNACGILRSLRGVEFDWNAIATENCKDLAGHDVGLIAQEVESLIPSAIGTIWGEYKRLYYTKITPYLVEGWKAHDDEIQRLKTKIKQLEERIYELGR